MINWTSKALITLITLFIAGCSTQLQDYQGSSPQFDLRSYFSHPVTAWGIIEDYKQKKTRHFCVDIIPTWNGDKGQLHETFYFNDGEQQIRIWQLHLDENGQVTGSAGDVIGEASGSAVGNAFNWQYTLRVPIDDTEYDFFIDDWMYQLDDNRVMNRSYMQKFGLTVAEISIFFDKTLPLRTCQQTET